MTIPVRGAIILTMNAYGHMYRLLLAACPREPYEPHGQYTHRASRCEIYGKARKSHLEV